MQLRDGGGGGATGLWPVPTGDNEGVNRIKQRMRFHFPPFFLHNNAAPFALYNSVIRDEALHVRINKSVPMFVDSIISSMCLFNNVNF